MAASMVAYTRIISSTKLQSYSLSYSVYHYLCDKAIYTHHAKYLKCTLRRYSSKKQFSHTVLLPKSRFPVRVSSETRVKYDQQTLKDAKFSELYLYQQAKNSTAKEFCIHDGPPYANGKPHLGHAINKILKDVTNRYKLLRGYRIHYIPGWDCHGLPIELKAISGNSDLKDPIEIRSKARKFALQSVQDQLEEFKKWGILADWSNCYHTHTENYVIKELKGFYKLYEKGYVFRDFKPVYWSCQAQTALAEAELEYDQNFKSTAVYVKYLLTKLPTRLINLNRPVHVVIWTTTPWTLPANKAICYHSDEKYVVIENVDDKSLLIVAKELLPSIGKVMGKDYTVMVELEGNELNYLSYKNLFFHDQEMPLIGSDHVSMDKGTGFVHTAPAHGHDDFEIGTKHNLSADCLVDEEGRYTTNAGVKLYGKSVLEEGNQVVMDLINNNIIHSHEYVHSYPLDWRNKKPVIIRTCKQWFIDTSRIKSPANDILEKISVYPESLKKTFTDQLKGRPYWCISRQRKWGVPIPVFYDKSEKPVMNKDVVDNLCNLIENQGTDVWWNLSTKELLPDSMKSEKDNFVKGEDILDIWFDSGMSWKAVLGENRIADYYIEGVDQIRGWFQSSLLTKTGLHNEAPYKNIYIHGFALDEKGRKMSKSLGNVISPSLITDGGKNKQKNPAYGVDVLRWWVAMHATGNMNINVGDSIIKESFDNVQKLRLTVKFILGALEGFNFENDHVAYQEMTINDQYLLHKISRYDNKIVEYYDKLRYNKATQEILHFVSTDVSALYCHIIKDRLYCDAGNSLMRRSCQTVLHHLLKSLLKSLAPILPHLSEEVMKHHPYEKESVFKTEIFKCDEDWINEDISSALDIALQLRNSINKAIKCNPRELDITIYTSLSLLEILKKFQAHSCSTNSQLCELFQVSEVLLESSQRQNLDEDKNLTIVQGDVNSERFILVISPAKGNICGRCRKYISKSPSQPCDRCLEVMGDQWE